MLRTLPMKTVSCDSERRRAVRRASPAHHTSCHSLRFIPYVCVWGWWRRLSWS